eukprot:2900696-Karenia_brevis.AAC.1
MEQPEDVAGGSSSSPPKKLSRRAKAKLREESSMSIVSQSEEVEAPTVGTVVQVPVAWPTFDHSAQQSQSEAFEASTGIVIQVPVALLVLDHSAQ